MNGFVLESRCLLPCYFGVCACVAADGKALDGVLGESRKFGTALAFVIVHELN